MATSKKTAKAEISNESAQALPVPEFTIRADSPAGMAVMVACYNLSLHFAPEQRQAIADKMREFELWEEQNRG